MLWMLDPAAAPNAAFHQVVDLASGQTVGWELLAAGGEAEPAQPPARALDHEMLGLLLTTRPVVPPGRFVVLRVSTRSLVDPGGRRLLGVAGRLDGVAIVLRGPINRDGLMLLEEVRERGALVGCDTATALIHFIALGPDVLSVPEPVTALAGDERAGAGVVRVLAGIAATSGAKALAHGVSSATECTAIA